MICTPCYDYPEMQTIQDIYKKTILPLTKDERKRLAEMIVRDIENGSTLPKQNIAGGVRDLFGTVRGRKPDLSHQKRLDHNEQIDRDLGLAYLEDHEDQES